MPSHKSAVKRMKTSQKKYARNLIIRSGLKTLLKKVDLLISSNKADQAKVVVHQAMSKFDKAASQGVVHKRNASRHKSRLAKKLKKLQAA
ncbi:MAG: 30S ribosomal protein S20 [Candidatus Omnitrophota bacterium]|nr:30S ribosomal protein S20 [Candidatus Omnitrophota bacterium]